MASIVTAKIGARNPSRMFGCLLLWVFSSLTHSAPTREEAWGARTVSLKNGLVVILAPDSTATSADVAVWYPVGMRSEGPNAAGMTRLVTQLMDRGRSGPGTSRRPIEAEGGSSSSMTHPDFSSTYATIPPEAVPLALSFTAARMRTREVDAGSLDRVRRGLENERRTRIDSSPAGLGLQRLNALAFAGHPYQRPLIGSDAELKSIKLAQVEEFLSERYTADRACLTVVGRFDPGTTLALIRREFEALPGHASAPEAPDRLSPSKGESEAILSASTPVSILMIGWRGPSDADGPALELLAQILTGGPASRLERGLVATHPDFLSVDSDLDRRKEASLLYCVAALRPGADTSAAKRALIGEVERFAAEPPLVEDIDRARRHIEKAYLFAWQTARGRAQALGMAQMLEGDFREATARLERIRGLSPNDVQHAAARILSAPNRSIVWVMPAGQADATRGTNAR